MKKKGKKVIRKSVLNKKKQSQKTPVKTKVRPHPKQKGKKISRKSGAKKSPVKTQKKVSPKSKKLEKRSIVKKSSLKTKPKGSKQRKSFLKTRPLRKTIHKKSEEDRKATLRKTLIQKREEIIREAKAEISKYIKGETKQLVDTALDDGDWSVIDLSEDISLRRLSTHRETLLKIDEALRKFDEGTYGMCEDCEDEIQEERLKILPFAIYCRDCQEKREQLEEAEKAHGAGF